MSASGPAPTPPAGGCPGCGASLTGGPGCPCCRLRLTGPEAARLWQVDQALGDLDARRTVLLTERRGLLLRLRPAAPGSQTVVPDAWSVPEPSAGRAAETSPRSAQNTLLGLGALLLAVAATVFTAVTYDRLGAGGRAVVLLLLTALAASTVAPLLRRGLTASAETSATVTLVLGALDLYGLREVGLGAGLRGTTYAAAGAAALALLCAPAVTLTPLRLPRLAGVLLAQLPPLLLLAGAGAGPATVALVLAGLASVDLAAARFAPSRLGPGAGVGAVALVSGLVAAGIGLAAALTAALTGDPGPGAVGLLAYAALAGAVAVLTTGPARLLAATLPVPLLALAAEVLVRDRLADGQEPLVAAAAALLAVLAAAQLPRAWRPGPVGGAVLVAAVGVLSQTEPVVEAVLRPLLWVTAPWTRASGIAARASVGPLTSWTGTLVTPVVLFAAAAVVAVAARCLHRLREGLPVAAALVVVTAVLLPLGLDTSYAVALFLQLLAGGALLAGGTLVRRADLGAPLLAAGAAVALLAAAWSVADRTATLVVLPLVALAFGAVAARPLPGPVTAAATALAAGVGAGTLAAGGAAGGLHTDQVGALLLLAPAVLLALAAVLRGPRRPAAEATAAALAVVAVGLAADDAGWLSIVLAASGLLALAGALRADRRLLAPAGALLLSASSWVRLADAGVHAPEAYVLPLGLVALLLGHLRRRRVPGTGSFAAYGPGLATCLLPSLLAALDGDGLARPLLLGLAALAVLLAGVLARLRAPLVLGGTVLALVAVRLLAPYAAALPRWMPLALAGALLVGLGATYEQRRCDLGRLRSRYGALS